MQHTEKFIKKRRMLMVLPILCFPFVTLFFWALGGGQGISAQAAPSVSVLNMELPDPHFNAYEKWDKLSIYDRTTRDSMDRDDALTLEPYFELAALKETKQEDTVRRDQKRKDVRKNSNTYSGSTPSGNIDPIEEKVNKKLEQLYQQLNAPVSSTPAIATTPLVTAKEEKAVTSSEIEQLEKIMQSMNESATSDPEMEQIQNVLEKILDIQHPERVKQKLQQQAGSIERKTYRVDGKTNENSITQLSPPNIYMDTVIYPVTSYHNGFYGIEDEYTTSTEANAITAVVHDTQEIVSGSTIRLRLTQEVTLNGVVIPKDEFIFGTCTISGARLMININSLQHENSIYPVTLTAYDMDGMPGIDIPGAIVRDVAKQSTDQALQSVQMMSVDPTIEMQAATIGLESAKGFLSKKTKLITATVKAEHPLLLKDTGLQH